jgi:VWFA-related protein
MKVLASFGLFLVILANTCSIQAQSQSQAMPEYSVRTTTRVVIVDAVVTDGKSQPVAGLSASDFVVLEDGKPQKISFFSYESPAKREQAISPPKLRPDVFTNRPEYHRAAGPITVILLDGLNTPTNQQIYARQQILRYLSKMDLSSTGTAILALGNELTVLQNFTTSPELLKTAVDSYVRGRTFADIEAPKIDIPVTTGPGGGGPAAANLSIGPTGTGDVAASVASQTNVTNSFAMLADSLKRFDKGVQVNDQDLRIRTTLAALRAIAKSVEGYPGRKSLLWFSAGFPFSLSLDEAMDLEFSKSYRDPIRQASTLLADAAVAVYPIDTLGLVSTGGLADPSASSKMANTIQDAAPSTSLGPESFSKFGKQETMDQIALDTGGLVFRNTNDLSGALQAAMKDSESYYVLGYYPERKKWDGKFHKIKVVPADKQLRVRSREGYYATDPANWRKGDDKALISADNPSALNATGLLFYAHAIVPEKKNQPTTVEILLDANTVSYGDGPEATYTTDLEFQVGAFTPDGKLQKVESQVAQADLHRDTHAQLLKTGMPVKMEITLPPGRYLVRVAARDNRNGHLGTVDVPVTVK